ncbi:MAG: cupin domain-containing protein [Candidatus Hodarchaeota archaeon]
MEGKIFRSEEILWIEPPGHFNAYSKVLISSANSDTKYFDFRISSYQPKGYCEPHIHKHAENIYYILKGKGIVELNGSRKLVEPHMVVFIPPGVKGSEA